MVDAVRSGAPESRLTRIAEQYRVAMLGVIKGERHCLQVYCDDRDSDDRQQRLLKLDERQDYWQALTVEEIVEMCERSQI